MREFRTREVILRSCDDFQSYSPLDTFFFCVTAQNCNPIPIVNTVSCFLPKNLPPSLLCQNLGLVLYRVTPEFHPKINRN